MNDTNPKPFFTILVPNLNGRAYLRRGLGSLLLSARETKKPYEFIVVDDASQDDGAALIEREFPMINLIQRKENGGFGRAVNQGIAAAKSDIVVLCNNDAIVRAEFIPRLLEGMAEENVFAVSAKTIDWDRGEPNHVEMFAVWREGLLSEDFADRKERCDTVFVQGGACALLRDEFLAMGGFADLFAPGYWEDYDLAYLARKRGWRTLYDPLAIANHLGKASLSARYGRDKLEILRRRNQILFTWLNLSDFTLWARHLIEFPAAVARDMAACENSPLAKGFVRAVARIPEVMAARRRRAGALRLKDREVLR